MRERDRVLENAEIAADWYDTIYSPVVETAERSWSDKDVPGADVFLLLHQRRREAFPSCGCPPLAETVPAEPPRKRRRLFGR
jgi:hypothetical protein